MGYTLQQLADHVAGRVVGDDTVVIGRVATLSDASPGSISFLTSSAYRKHLASTRASAVIIRENALDSCTTNALVVENPHVAYARIVHLLYPEIRTIAGIHPSAVVEESATIAGSAYIGPNTYIGHSVVISENVSIGPGCVLENGVKIDSNTSLQANVTIRHDCQLGKYCLVHPGVVIGSDGFGQANDNGVWVKIPQVGRVIIGDDVEIGANTTIDRGAIQDTVISDNVKLDNLIQIAHNVHIGAHTAIAAGAAIAGSARIGKHCTIAGMVGIAGHLEIADNVTITAMSLVGHSLHEPGVYSGTLPLDTNQQWRKNAVRFKQLDEMAKRLKKLESPQGK